MLMGGMEAQTPLRCPLNGRWFTPRNDSSYCIYALGICGTTYFTELLVNDAKFKSEMCADIELMDLKNSRIHPCEHDSVTFPAYGGGVVRVNSCRGGCKGLERMQVFFMCCRACNEVVQADARRMLTQLKLLYFAQSEFSLRSVVLKHGEGEQARAKEIKAMNFMIAKKLNEPQERRVCIRGNGTDVDVTATLLNKNACVSVIGVRNPLFNSSQLRNMRSPHEIRAELGEQIISVMDLSENVPAYHFGLNSCRKDYRENVTMEDTCKMFIRGDESIFICCCYGEAPITCQMRLQNGISPSYVAMAAWDIRCMMNEGRTSGYGNDTLLKVVQEMEKKDIRHSRYFAAEVVRSGISYQLQNVCESTIYRHEKKIHFVHNNRSTTPLNIQKVKKCEELYYNDFRLNSFLHKPCFPTLPPNTMCPFNHNAKTDSFEAITCCCSSSGFCNVDLFLRNRVLYRPDDNCAYNNDYQHLTNKFFLEDSIENHSCIVHFANWEVMQDLGVKRRTHGQVLNIYPGAAIMPIDYSYAALGVNECDYIETKVNLKYLGTRNCPKTAATLESNYLPLKLFVCRCSTNSAGTRRDRCDIELRKTISKKEGDKATETAVRHRTYCAVRSSRSLVDFVHDITKQQYQKFNKVSSICFTKAVFDVGSGDAVKFEAGRVRRKMFSNMKMPLDHIAYLLLVRFATDEDRCMTVTSNKTVTAFCFCRKYTNDGALSCNSDQKEIVDVEKINDGHVGKQSADSGNKIFLFTAQHEVCTILGARDGCYEMERQIICCCKQCQHLRHRVKSYILE